MPNWISTYRVPSGVYESILVALYSERTHSAPIVSCTNFNGDKMFDQLPAVGNLVKKVPDSLSLVVVE